MKIRFEISFLISMFIQKLKRKKSLKIELVKTTNSANSSSWIATRFSSMYLKNKKTNDKNNEVKTLLLF